MYIPVNTKLLCACCPLNSFVTTVCIELLCLALLLHILFYVQQFSYRGSFCETDVELYAGVLYLYDSWLLSLCFY